MIKINLKNILRDRKITMLELHQMTGISQNTLSLFANQKSSGVQYPTIEKIVRALNVEVGELIEHVENVYDLSVETTVDKEEGNTIFISSKLIFTNTSNSEETYNVKIPLQMSLSLYPNTLEVNIAVIEINKTPVFSSPYIHALYTMSSDGKPKEIFYITAYMIVKDILDNLQRYKCDLNSTIIFIWKQLLPKFFFGNNFEGSENNKKLIKNSSNMFFVKREIIVSLVPKNPDLEFDIFHIVQDVMPNLDGLIDFSTVYSVEIDKNNFDRKLKIVLD